MYPPRFTTSISAARCFCVGGITSYPVVSLSPRQVVTEWKSRFLSGLVIIKSFSQGNSFYSWQLHMFKRCFSASYIIYICGIYGGHVKQKLAFYDFLKWLISKEPERNNKPLVKHKSEELTSIQVTHRQIHQQYTKTHSLVSEMLLKKSTCGTHPHNVKMSLLLY